MLYNRRKIILALLDAFGGTLNKISIQKLLFLFTRNQADKCFDFLPYKFGCYSFQLNQDLHTLKNYGYIEEKNDDYQLSSLNSEITINLFDNQILNQIKKDFINYTTEDLKTYTYQKYPYYAINSTIITDDRVGLSKDEIKKILEQKKDILKKYKNMSCVFSFGYEGVSLEKYINYLIIYNVKVLCDVRKNAFSQKYGFSKATLQNACEGVGIQYIHIPDLGIESNQRQNLLSQKDYDILFEYYKKHTLPNNTNAFNYLTDIIRRNSRVVLTCFEKDPKQCHRTVILDKLKSLNFNTQNIILNT